MKLKRLLGSLAYFLLASCVGVTTQPDHPTKPLAEKQKDLIECSALASQAAQGAGGIFSDPAIQNAFYLEAKEKHLALCLESRGWVTQPQTSAVKPPYTEVDPMRKCFQHAYSWLGFYEGPIDGLLTGVYQATVKRYYEEKGLRSYNAWRSTIENDMKQLGKTQEWRRCLENAVSKK